MELVGLLALPIVPIALTFEVRPVTADGNLQLGDLVLKLSDLRLKGLGVFSTPLGVRGSTGR